VLGGAVGDLAQHLAGGRVLDREGPAAAGLAPLPADEQPRRDRVDDRLLRCCDAHGLCLLWHVPGRRSSLARRLARGGAGGQASFPWGGAGGWPARGGVGGGPTERAGGAAAAVGDRVWVLGGYAADGATLATVEVYDTGADTWARGADPPG